MNWTKHPSLLEEMASTSKRLVAWIAISIGLVAAGISLSLLKLLEPYKPENLFIYLSGFITSSALASWSVNSIERNNRRAIVAFWKAFSINGLLVLPSSDSNIPGKYPREMRADR